MCCKTNILSCQALKIYVYSSIKIAFLWNTEEGPWMLFPSGEAYFNAVKKVYYILYHNSQWPCSKLGSLTWSDHIDTVLAPRRNTLFTEPVDVMESDAIFPRSELVRNHLLFWRLHKGSGETIYWVEFLHPRARSRQCRWWSRSTKQSLRRSLKYEGGSHC